MIETLPTVTILGVPVHRVDVAGTLAQIAAWRAAPPGPAPQISPVTP